MSQPNDPACSALDRAPFHRASVLITGGTGSIGRRLVADLLAVPSLSRVTVLSRDYLKQDQLRIEHNDPRLHFALEDVARPARMDRLCARADVVIHAAAVKAVHRCESAPEYAIQSNVQGTLNVLSCAVAANVPLIIAISSDKAIQPVNVYGATKLLVERIFHDASAHADSRLLCVRLCNVAGSRGGIIARLLEDEDRPVSLTHPEMTRFFMSEGQASRLIADCAADGASGEIFVPNARSIRILDLIERISGRIPPRAMARREAERLYERLVGPDEYLLRTTPGYSVVSSRSAGQSEAAGEMPRFRSDSELALMDSTELSEFLNACGIPCKAPSERQIQAAI